MKKASEFVQLDQISLLARDSIDGITAMVDPSMGRPRLIAMLRRLTGEPLEVTPELDSVAGRCEALAQFRLLGIVLDIDRRRLVKQLRLAGATWKQIGDALGCSRSAAQQRYDYLADGLAHDAVADTDTMAGAE